MHKSIEGIVPPIKKVVVNYRISPLIKAALQRNAARTGRKMNTTVELALEQHKPLQEDLKAVKGIYDTTDQTRSTE